MYCSRCGKHYPEKVNFCCDCGAALGAYSPPKKLTLSRQHKKIAGVCGGFAEYLDVDPTLVRVVWLMLVFFGGWGLIGYFVAWLVMPEAPAAAAESHALPFPSPHTAPNR